MSSTHHAFACLLQLATLSTKWAGLPFLSRHRLIHPFYKARAEVAVKRRAAAAAKPTGILMLCLSALGDRCLHRGLCYCCCFKLGACGARR